MGSISVAIPVADRWYFPEVLSGAVSRIEAAGHEPQVHRIPVSGTSTADAAAAIEGDLANSGSLGAVAAGFKFNPEQTARALARGRPIVAIGGSVPGFPSVMIDDAGGARLATDHLLELGHTRIMHLTESLQDQADFVVYGRRVKGYRTRMEGAGLQPVVVAIEDGFRLTTARAVALDALSVPSPPTAIFAASDDVALAVLDAASELGIEVGTALSVIGFDDKPDAALHDLTTIRQQPAMLGATAVELVLGAIDGNPESTRSRLLPITLVKRGSTRRSVAR